jgi:hypothetical protein
MLVSLLGKFKKTSVELSKVGVNNKERYQTMNKWINKNCETSNFDIEFINYMN